jgi:ATP-dependent DNA ligase
MAFPFDPPLVPMEAKVREAIPTGAWAYEPKWDGFRAVAWAGDGQARLDSRNTKPLLRYFPELAPALAALPPGSVVDGEVVVVRDGRTDFDALQNRIHPAASRIALLAGETPAELLAFDLLAADGDDLRAAPFTERRTRLVALMAQVDHPAWHLTPSTTDAEQAARWFAEFESAGCDGLVCKALDGVYEQGRRAMVKVKHRRTVDCVVGGYRLHKEGDRVGSILLGLHAADGQLHFIGHCSGFGDADRVRILEQLRRLESTDAFGTTVRRPGEVSRWTGDKDLSWVPLAPELVVEVSYDQLTGERFRHATRFERWRPDKEPGDCTMDQLERPEGPVFGDIVLG